MKLRTRLGVTLLVAAMATACSGDRDEGGPRAAADVDAPTAPSSTAPAGDASPASATPPATRATETPTPAPTTATFISPSGNLVCFLSADEAICEVGRASYDPPPKPADCDLDHGTMVSVGRETPAEFLCHGDTGFGGQDPVLGYGERRGNENLVCTSRRSGMTCERIDGSAGFELSRERYRLF